MQRKTLFRYAGGKGKFAKPIVDNFPPHAEQYDYYEPFLGSAPVAFRTIRTVPFKSYNLSDSFEWLTRLWWAIRGDLDDWGDIVERLAEARSKMLPESEHEPLIRLAFEDAKLHCRLGDYFSYMFLCQYALQQFVMPQRKDTACFNPAYLRDGICYITVPWLLEWREAMQRATIMQQDAFDVLESLDASCMAYIDAPYMGHQQHRFRLYAHDWFSNEHERLRDILLNAPFKWALSINDMDDAYEWYLSHPDFTAIPLRYPGTPARAKNPQYYEWLVMNY